MRIAARITGGRSRFINRLQHSCFLLPEQPTCYLWLKGSQQALALPGFATALRTRTGIPNNNPTGVLTRATYSSLYGRTDEAFQWHAFGPLVAAALLFWSFDAIRCLRFQPKGLRSWPLISTGAELLIYWVLRLGLRYGIGIPTFTTG